jgi:hypothetical protein
MRFPFYVIDKKIDFRHTTGAYLHLAAQHTGVMYAQLKLLVKMDVSIQTTDRGARDAALTHDLTLNQFNSITQRSLPSAFFAR